MSFGLESEGGLLSSFGHFSSGGGINNDGDTTSKDVAKDPSECGTCTSTIEIFKLFISQDLVCYLSLSRHWSWFGCVCVNEAIASDAHTIAELTEE